MAKTRKVELTEAELAFLEKHRHRIALDTIPWELRDQITARDLSEMSPWRAHMVLANSYSYDPLLDVYLPNPTDAERKRCWKGNPNFG